MTDTLELKNDRTTKLIDISGSRKLISDTPDLIGFLTDDKLEELEIKETVTEKQKRYVKLLDETEAEVEVEVLNYDFSSGWENLRKLKLGNRELLIPEGEKLTSMSDIAFLTEEGDISEDIIVNTKDEQGIYTYAYNGETKEFEKHDAKEFILGELEITETELDNLIEMLRYVKSDNRSVFLEHNFRVLSFERLKKYIEVVEPGLCEETIDRYKTEDTDVISLLDIEDINIDELKKINEMDDYVIKHFRVAFGNRIVTHLGKFVAAYVACGGDEVEGIDYFMAKKVLRKFEQLNIAYIKDEIDGFVTFLDKTFGKGKMKECIEYVLRLKKLG